MSDEKLEFSTFYADLDAIFDTRAAILYQYGVETLIKALEDQYDKRLTDDFPSVDQADFKRRYKERNKMVLRDAMITPVVKLITFMAKETLKAILTTPVHRQPKLVVNIYPYELGEEEIATIIKALSVVTEGLLDIEVISKTYTDITPEFVKTHFTTMIMYDYWKWLNEHVENQNLGKTPCSLVGLIGPMLCNNKEAIPIAAKHNVFSQLEANYSPFIRLMLYPSEYFSLDLRRLIKSFQDKAKKE